MKIKLLKASLALTSLLVMATGPVLAQESPASNDGMCSIATLRGSFGYVSWGALLASYAPPPNAGPFGEMGRQTFDGHGHATAVATFSANGNIVQNFPLSGTYVVNPDCTGSWTLNSALGPVHADFVIDEFGTEIQAVSTDSGVIETRVYRKQSWGGR